MIPKATIVCAGGDISRKKLIADCRRPARVIACDGGLSTLDMLKIRPHYLIGDLDSASERLVLKYADVPREVFPKDKDLTDSEIALRYALSLNPLAVRIHGAAGDYIDHSYANMIMLLKNPGEHADIRIVTSNSEIIPLTGSIDIKEAKGRRFSLFPVGKVIGIRMSGCRYDFGAKKNIGPTDYSISNVITENISRISLQKGKALIVLFDRGYE